MDQQFRSVVSTYTITYICLVSLDTFKNNEPSYIDRIVAT